MSGLEEGESYVFKVCAVNGSGHGKHSQLSEPVCAKALPGNTANIYCYMCWIYSAPHLCMLTKHLLAFQEFEFEYLDVNIILASKTLTENWQ